MSVVSSFAKIRPRRGTQNAWSTANPILDEGEFVIELPDEWLSNQNYGDKGKIKVGDGQHTYNELPYFMDGEATATAIYGGAPGPNHHIIAIRSGSTEEWINSGDPIINLNEIVYDTTKNSFKVGNGNTPYSQLPFINAGGIIPPDIDGGNEDEINEG